MAAQLSLFGPPEALPDASVKSKKELDTPPKGFVPQSHAQTCRKFHDYEGFVAKFESKKTTDDCYTPPATYDAVLRWVREHCGIPADASIVRPFFPGADYEHADYPPGCVVVDNPPFSITRKIIRFYLDRGIKFFLFVPGLTCYWPGLDVCIVQIRHSMRFENGASVAVAFATNLIPQRVLLSGTLDAAIRDAQKEPDKSKRRIVLPDYFLTPGRARAYVPEDGDFALEAADVGDFFSLKNGRWSAFGGCLRLPESLVERLRAERLRAERLRAERLRAERLRAFDPFAT